MPDIPGGRPSRGTGTSKNERSYDARPWRQGRLDSSPGEAINRGEVLPIGFGEAPVELLCGRERCDLNTRNDRRQHGLPVLLAEMPGNRLPGLYRSFV